MNLLTFDHQILVRLAAFGGLFLIMAAWEVIAPRRVLRTPKPVRWFNNLSLTLFDSLAGPLAVPFSVMGLAAGAEAQGWGILNTLTVSPLTAGVVSLVILDLTIYTQHLCFHRVRILWLLHGVHHTDLDIDVTTGTRFHPLEIVLSLLIKMGIVVLVGIPAWAYLIFEVLLNGTSLFNHSNVRIHPKVDGFLRRFLVTPDMHRVHHSVIIGEHDRNFGFNLSWWDRLFGTYRDQPRAGHAVMVLGLANFRDPQRLSFLRLLALPFTEGRKY
ncbi:MAG: sterol desaturase family protein [Deltaproteobacteria bacterium]|nr:sterol desaturase family protein [Deltaproteobacteria bacterium]